MLFSVYRATASQGVISQENIRLLQETRTAGLVRGMKRATTACVEAPCGLDARCGVADLFMAFAASCIGTRIGLSRVWSLFKRRRCDEDPIASGLDSIDYQTPVKDDLEAYDTITQGGILLPQNISGKESYLTNTPTWISSPPTALTPSVWESQNRRMGRIFAKLLPSKVISCMLIVLTSMTGVNAESLWPEAPAQPPPKSTGLDNFLRLLGYAWQWMALFIWIPGAAVSFIYTVRLLTSGPQPHEEPVLLALLNFAASLIAIFFMEKSISPSDGLCLPFCAWACLIAPYAGTQSCRVSERNTYIVVWSCGAVVFSLFAGVVSWAITGRDYWACGLEFGPPVVTLWTWLLTVLQQHLEDKYTKNRPIEMDPLRRGPSERHSHETGLNDPGLDEERPDEGRPNNNPTSESIPYDGLPSEAREGPPDDMRSVGRHSAERQSYDGLLNETDEGRTNEAQPVEWHSNEVQPAGRRFNERRPYDGLPDEPREEHFDEMPPAAEYPGQGPLSEARSVLGRHETHPSQPRSNQVDRNDAPSTEMHDNQARFDDTEDRLQTPRAHIGELQPVRGSARRTFHGRNSEETDPGTLYSIGLDSSSEASEAPEHTRDLEAALPGSRDQRASRSVLKQLSRIFKHSKGEPA